MLLLHAKGPQRTEQRPGTEDSQAWPPGGSLGGTPILVSTTIVVPRKLRSRCKVKKHWYEAKEILERDPDPLPGSGPQAQTVQALLGGGPLGPGLGSSAEFRGENLPFRQSRGHGDIKLIEEVFNAPSFVTIGQELPKICFRKSCAQNAHIGVGAENSRP